ncbi:hypothetical protein NEMBOFW57_001457 [Staphylotrichum longicolle]|uniref:Uncharacterized protein n=1 Tax=Staphylotrichum longicolle TaxID=669026 RepID=A0AAD4I3S8_9PEZI|nr:hypothetical protein NEMBOFW57_001457 [Staphylotrichum longicolle]
MCHICQRLGIKIDYPPPKTAEEIEKEAAEEAAQEEAEDRKREQEYLELVAQGKPIPQPPRKQLGPPKPPTKVIAEPAPSHDGTPTFAAYEVPVALLGPNNSPPSQNPEKYRPPFGIRFYDITPTATPERAALLARRISELTHDARYNDRCYDKDRIEVVAMPLRDLSMTAEDRAARCIRHNEAERAARLPIADATVASSWYIPESFQIRNYNKELFLICDLKDSWEDALRNPGKKYWREPSAHGYFRHVIYERKFGDSEEDDEDRERGFHPDVDQPLEMVGAALSMVRDDAQDFYTCHFIPEGVLDMQLALARADAAGVEVPRPVVIPFRPDAHK